LHAIDVPVATAAADGGDAAIDDDVVADGDAAIGDESATDSASATDSDTHLKRLLVADPLFMRSADELLNDPDPQVRLEARQLLRDLGAAVPAASDER
jgi:hypothetical protein